MKKKILSIIFILIIGLSLIGCDFNGLFSNATTITSPPITIDNKSIVDAIYSEVYEKAKQDLYKDIYDSLYEEFVDGEIDAETIQQQIYDVVIGPGKANVGVYNYQYSNEMKEVVRNSSGSGVIYEKQELTDSDYRFRYYFVTNEHVTEGATKLTVYLEDESEIIATLVGEDANTDVAVLYFDTDRFFEVAEFGDSSTLKKGQMVLAIGNPKGQTLYGSISFGIIGGTDRHIVTGSSTDTVRSFIQHDAVINHGNSGGGLFTLDGKCVGLNEQKYVADDAEGLGFAIPINVVKDVASEIRETGKYTGTVSLGISVRPVADLYANERLEYDVPSSVQLGVLVIDVTAGSSSDGILFPKDIIIKMGKEGQALSKINTTSDVSPFIRNSRIGDTVNIVVLREGVEITVPVTFKRTTPVVAPTE